MPLENIEQTHDYILRQIEDTKEELSKEKRKFQRDRLEAKIEVLETVLNNFRDEDLVALHKLIDPLVKGIKYDIDMILGNMILTYYLHWEMGKNAVSIYLKNESIHDVLQIVKPKHQNMADIDVAFIFNVISSNISSYNLSEGDQTFAGSDLEHHIITYIMAVNGSFNMAQLNEKVTEYTRMAILYHRKKVDSTGWDGNSHFDTWFNKEFWNNDD